MTKRLFEKLDLEMQNFFLLLEEDFHVEKYMEHFLARSLTEIAEKLESSEENMSISDFQNQVKIELGKQLEEEFLHYQDSDFVNSLLENIVLTEDEKKNRKKLKELEQILSFSKYEADIDFAIYALNKNENIGNFISSIKKTSDKFLEMFKEGYQLLHDADIEDLENDLDDLESLSNYDEEDFNKNDYYTRQNKGELDGLKIYFNSIPTKILTPEEEFVLATKAHEGDLEARNQFVAHNLKLVVKIAHKYINSELSIEDLIQEGNIGVLKAIEKFDPTKGYKFSTYATWWIRQAIVRAVDDKGKNIRIPVHMQQRMREYKKVRASLSVSLNREPTNQEIAKEMNLSVQSVENIFNSMIDTVSMNEKINKDSEDEFGNFIPDSANVEEEVLSSLDKKMLENYFDICKLNTREKEVIKARFGMDQNAKTLQQVADIYGITRERVRQIEFETLRKLRSHSNLLKEEIQELSTYDKHLVSRMNNSSSLEQKKAKEKEKRPKVSKTQLTIYMEYPNYPKKEIDAALASLKREDLELLFLKYDRGLIGFSKEQEEQIHTIKTKVIRELLEEKEKVEPIKEDRKLSGIYERLDKYNPIVVNKAIDSLSFSQKELLKEKYGPDFTQTLSLTPRNKELERKVSVLIYQTLKVRINHILEGKVGLYKSFPNYTKEQVNQVVNLLSSKDKALLIKRYGENLEEDHLERVTDQERSDINNKIKRYIKTSLNVKEEPKMYTYKNLYERLNQYSPDAINKALESLPDVQREKLKEKYGKKLLDTTNGKQRNKKFEQSISNIIYGSLIQKIEDVINNKAGIYNTITSYSEEEVRSAIDKLEDREKALIIKKYGKDYKEYHYDRLSKEERIEINTSISPKIRQYLNNPEFNPRKTYANTNIFDYYKDIESWKVLGAIESLSLEEIELMQKVYGTNFHSIHEDTDLTKEERERLGIIIREKVKRRIEKGYKPIDLNQNLYQILEWSDETQINSLLKTLSKEDLELIDKKYDNKTGEVLENVLEETEEKTLKYLLLKMKKQLFQEEGRMFRHQDLYMRFNDYTKEEVDKILTRLSPQEKKLLDSYYDEKTLRWKNKEISSEEQKQLSILTGKIRRNLKNKPKRKNYNDIYTSFDEYTEEEINCAIEKLSDRNKEILKKKFGEDFKHPTNMVLNENESSTIYRVFNTLLPKLLKPEQKVYHYKSLLERFEEYDPKVILKAVESLPNKQKEILQERYGKDLSKNSSLKSFGKKANVRVSSIIKNSLPSRIEDVLIDRSGIYKYFLDYDHAIIDEAISKMPEEQIALLQKKYGKDYRENHNDDLTVEEKNVLHTKVMKRMERLIRNPALVQYGNQQKIEGGYEYLSDYSKEEVQEAFSKLSEEEKKRITRRFGEDFDRPECNTLTKQERSELYGTMKKLKLSLERMNGENLSKLIKYANLYDYYSEYSKEQVDFVLSTLKDEELEIIHKKYGKDLENPIEGELTYTEKAKFYTLNNKKIKPSLAKLKEEGENEMANRKRRDRSSYYTYFEEYDKATLDETFKKLIPTHQEKLHKIWGENLDEYNANAIETSLDLKNSFQGPIATTVKRIAKDLKQEKETMSCSVDNNQQEEYILTMKEFKNPIFNKVRENLPPKSQVILSLKFGLVDEQYYSIEAISNFLGIEKEEVITTVRNALKTYKASAKEALDIKLEQDENKIMNQEEKVFAKTKILKEGN